jgi:spore coat polysaccharide biosynthesis protein SpsF
MSDSFLLNAAVIIQARMGSTRLPGKTMLPLAGIRMFEHIVKRCSLAPVAMPVIVATSEKTTDDFIATVSESLGATCIRGDEADVLDRFWKAAADLDVDYIVRATADNPLVYESAVEHLGKLILDTGCDYITYNESMPVGLSVEIFTKKALQTSHQEGKEPFHREHVTPYIYTNPEKFDVIRIAAPQGLKGNFRLTVDTEEDYLLMKEIYQRLYTPGKIIPSLAAIELLRNEPELVSMNADIRQKSYDE